MTQERVSSPISTGGGGTFFEQHVDAFFLGLLLTRAIPPILTDCQVTEIRLQTAHEGWATDDLLVIGRRSDDALRQLVIQVKRQITVSSKNDEFVATIRAFWTDFRNADKFRADQDRLALVILRATYILLHSFNNVLDGARASNDGPAFVRRLNTPGHLSKTAQRHVQVIKAIIERLEQRHLTDEEIWSFLRVLHLLSLDLNTSTAQSETWIKSLLAHTATDASPVHVAENSWRHLLELVGSAMPVAASYTRSTLPQELQGHHESASYQPEAVVRALLDHSKTTFLGINTTLAHGVTIDRSALALQLITLLEQRQVLVVTGAAGSGKSALAKTAVEQLMKDHLCLVFRAEEFATPHFDQTLTNAHCRSNTRGVLSALAGQARKVILIESIERLLESSVRDALSDLLRFARSDQNLAFILTCRDYSLETVKHSLLAHAGISYRCISVPPLTDGELASAAQKLPGLALAIAEPRLKELLRAPYLLNMASQIDWADGRTLPDNERSFRKRCWRDVVKRDSFARDGMPARRERVFVELAVRRARVLSPFVQVSDFDDAALDALRRDDLVAMPSHTSSLAAPTHDVLEDWAILRWLNDRFAQHEGQPAALGADVGGYPAIRRGYRKWLGERLDASPQDASTYILRIIDDDTLPAYFRDDTLVCALVSSSANEFLASNRRRLLASDNALLIRVIHLLRVACKTAPNWLPDLVGLPSQLMVPEGPAWEAVVKLVSEELSHSLPGNLELTVGLIDDWARSVSLAQPEPPGTPGVGKIAFELLNHLDSYGLEDLRKRVLGVIAKVPKANLEATTRLLDRACALDHRDRIATDFVGIVLPGINGHACCRECPEAVARLVKATYCLTVEDLSDRNLSSIDVGGYFGFRDYTGQDMFPASAIRGPFYPLLKTHVDVGLNLIVELLNHAGQWYGEQRWPHGRLEPAVPVDLDVPGVGSVTQWANQRLWSLYRGRSVGPYVIQTALMALEKWLLELCEDESAEVDQLLLRLLGSTNNVAITAVVSSICNARTEKSGRVGLALLSCKDLIQIDRVRMSGDYGLSPGASLWTGLDPANEFYQKERQESDTLPHRRQDLEALAVKLQLGAHREEVWGLIDRYREELPPVAEQSEENKLWRLALHRMDIRGYEPVQPPRQEEETRSEATSSDDGTVYLGLGKLEEDIQKIVDDHAPVQAQVNADLELLHWGRAMWDRSQSSVDPAAWQSYLERAQERVREQREVESFARGGPEFIAAVCVRDRWNDLTPENREWSVSTLVREIERNADSEDETLAVAKGMFADRPAAYVLPRILREGNAEQPDGRLLTSLAIALTHWSSEVIAYASEGVGQFLQGDWLGLGLRCAAALARQAAIVKGLVATEKKKPYQERIFGARLARVAAPEVRPLISDLNSDLNPEDELANLDLSSWPGQVAAKYILPILAHYPRSAVALAFHKRIVSHLVQQWDLDRRDRDRAARRDFHFEADCSRRVAGFVLRLSAPDALDVCGQLAAAVADHPRDTSQFLRALILEEDAMDAVTPFWEIWQAFADSLRSAPWLEYIDSQHATGQELVMLLFLWVDWKKGLRHWSRLESPATRIDNLVETLPPSTVVLEAYLRFLEGIGGESLPNGLLVVARRLEAGSAKAMLARDNTIYFLESILRRFVYGEPLRLKSNAELRRAVLRILDELVEVGSSATYRMRDDFVTPVGSTQ